jgi:hypothetical protein
MQTPKPNFEDFELPFFNSVSDDSSENESDEDEEPDTDSAKEDMEVRIPESAKFLGSIETYVENWTSWKVHDDYYIIPLNEKDFDWALFRISWDDNFNKWDWSADARLKGFPNDHRAAGKIMLKELWKKWSLNLKEPENEVYADMLSGI